MRNIKKILVIVFMFAFFISVVKAGDASISASSTTVTVGTTVAVTVKTTNLWGTYTIYSSNKSVLNGDNDSNDIGQDNWSKTLYFNANSIGTSTIIFGPSQKDMLGDPYSNPRKFFNETRSITINVVKKSTNSNTTIDVNKTYNKNNYLKNLSIDDYTLTPSFNKDILEYNVELKPGTEVININASVEDKTASVKGIGEVNVSEGINTINVVVTAQNGNEKIYVIKASVEEKDPIIIELDGKKYRVVKKLELLSTMDGYSDTTVLINKFDIPALYNDVTKVTLVGLKDENGTIALFAYDSGKGEYKEYKEFTFDRMNLYIHKDSKSKYKETKIKINDKEVTAYKLDGVTDYYLLYATNTTTGNEGYYLYDTKENSVQRYNTTMLEKLTKEKDKYLSIVLVLSSVCFLSMLFLLIEVNKDNKRKNEE